MGQIRSSGLSNVLVVVVRYFGGTKLGVGGLIQAYKTAAADALAHGEIIEKHETSVVGINFGYAQMNEVMSLIKDFGLTILDQEFGLACSVKLEVRNSICAQVVARFGKIDQVEVAVEE